MKSIDSLTIHSDENTLTNLYLEVKNKLDIFCAKYQLKYTVKLEKGLEFNVRPMDKDSKESS